MKIKKNIKSNEEIKDTETITCEEVESDYKACVNSAIQDIKAAIEKLGDAKDFASSDEEKSLIYDSIANLSVVLFDIKQ